MKWGIRETEGVPFSTLAIEYIEYAEANKAESTFYSDRCRIEGHLMPLTQITPQMLDSYKQMRIKEGASANTVNHELTNLSHMLKMAIRWRYIDRNVVSSVDKMKVPERSPRFLSQDEIRLISKVAEGSYLYPIIMTALHTGLRKSELLNLKWVDVDFNQRTITVQSKPDWHTKNYKIRVLQMTPVLYNVLKTHRKLHLELGIQNDYVFTYRGHKISSNIKRTLRGIVKKAGLENVTLHTLRHTFASQLVMAGVPLREVQELMGHQSFETTLQYAHLSEDHVKRQVLRLPFANG